MVSFSLHHAAGIISVLQMRELNLVKSLIQDNSEWQKQGKNSPPVSLTPDPGLLAVCVVRR